MADTPLNDLEIETLVLELLKQRGSNASIASLQVYEFMRKNKNLEVDHQMEEFIDDVFHRLTTRGLLRPISGIKPLYKMTVYGRAALSDESEFILLEPSAYIRKLREKVPNIDSITIQYIRESLEALSNDLIISATVTLGAASERAILELVDSYCSFSNDPGIKKRFEKAWSIKLKYELLKSEFKERQLSKELPQQLAARGIEVEDLDRHFVEFETIIDNLFQIYRISRNEAGHPTGIEMYKDVLRCNLAAFRRYAETIFGIKAALDALG